jgi:hypothetical protein
MGYSIMATNNYTTSSVWWWLVMLLAVSSVIGASTLTDWGSIWAIVAGSIAALIFVWRIIGWLIRRIILTRPCNIHFLIPSEAKVKLEYVKQDKDGHSTNCLIIPANATITTLVYIRPRIEYEEIETYFGFEGDIDNKPKLIKFYNYFILEGKREIKPGEEGQYIDTDKLYHIPRNMKRTSKEDYVVGFKVETYAVGRYEFRAFFLSTEGKGTASLSVIVEDPLMTQTRCIQRHHLNCFLKPNSNSRFLSRM